jgi:hypothetical protein
MPNCPECAERVSRDDDECPHCGASLGGRSKSSSKSGGSKKKKSKKSGSNSSLPIVLAVAGVLLVGCCLVMPALLLPAVQQARTAARKAQSSNNLKQIGLAFHNYHDTFQVFPPGIIADSSNKPYAGWEVQILPYLDQAPLYNLIDSKKPWDDPANLNVGQNMVPAFIDQNIDAKQDSQGLPVSHYAANSQLMPTNKSLKMMDITDGTSNTILCGTMAGDFRGWITPANVRDPAKGWNNGPDSFGHPLKIGGILLLSDGSTRMINSNIDPNVMKALGTPAGGEPPPMP